MVEGVKDVKDSGSAAAEEESTENNPIEECAAGPPPPAPEAPITPPVTAGQDFVNRLGQSSEGLNSIQDTQKSAECQLKDEKPSDEEKAEFQKEASESLDKQLGALTSPEDRAKAHAMQDAILKGDNKALGAIVAGMTPEQLKNFSTEIQKNLDSLGAGITVKPTGDGSSLFVHEQGSSTGMIINKDGTTRPVSVKEGPDGKTHIDNTSTPTDDAATIAGSISDAATLNGRDGNMRGGGGSNGKTPPDGPSGPVPPNDSQGATNSSSVGPIIPFQRLKRG